MKAPCKCFRVDVAGGEDLTGDLSEDGAAGGYFDSGYAAAEQDEHAAAVGRPQRAAILRKGRDHVVDHLGLDVGVGIFVHDVQVVAAAEPYAEYQAGHGRLTTD